MSDQVQKFDPHKYWEDRHRAYGTDLRSVGNKTFDDAANRDQLIEKAVWLGWLFGALGQGPGTRLLDAGCGQGFLTRLFQGAGWQCHGIDVSHTAIEMAQAANDGVTYEAGPLEEIETGETFDLCLLADVTYHVVEDDRLDRILARLLSVLAPGGRLVVIEYFPGVESVSPHCRWRNREDYDRRLVALGARILRQDKLRESRTGHVKDVLTIGRD